MKVKEAAMLFNVQQIRMSNALLKDYQQHVEGEQFEDEADKEKAMRAYALRAKEMVDAFVTKYALNYLLWHLLRVKEAGSESVKLTMARSGDQAWRAFVKRLESGLALQYVGPDDFKNHVKARCNIEL